MNCVRCGVQLEANARFCRNCGLPVATSQPQHVLVSPPEDQTPDNTIPISSLVQQLNTPSASAQYPYQQQVPLPQQDANTISTAYSSGPTFQQSTPQAQAPLRLYLPHDTAKEVHSTVADAPRRRNRLGCALGCLGTLFVLILLLGATWIFALRPYLHDVAVTQMDTMMTNVVNQIPEVGLPIPPGTTLPISEDTVNAVLSNNAGSPDPAQSTNIQISANQILLDFKLYGQDCTITGIPQMQNGKLVATNVVVSGIIGLVLSPKDITTLLNSHFEDAQTRINHQVTQVQLKDHEIDVTV